MIWQAQLVVNSISFLSPLWYSGIQRGGNSPGCRVEMSCFGYFLAPVWCNTSTQFDLRCFPQITLLGCRTDSEIYVGSLLCVFITIVQESEKETGRFCRAATGVCMNGH